MGNKLFVGGLKWEATEDDLQKVLTELSSESQQKISDAIADASSRSSGHDSLFIEAHIADLSGKELKQLEKDLWLLKRGQ